MPPASERSEAILHYTSGLMIGQMIRAFGADDVAWPGSSSENYVFR
jgi:hypothetical protein